MSDKKGEDEIYAIIGRDNDDNFNIGNLNINNQINNNSQNINNILPPLIINNPVNNNLNNNNNQGSDTDSDSGSDNGLLDESSEESSEELNNDEYTIDWIDENILLMLKMYQAFRGSTDFIEPSANPFDKFVKKHQEYQIFIGKEDEVLRLFKWLNDTRPHKLIKNPSTEEQLEHLILLYEDKITNKDKPKRITKNDKTDEPRPKIQNNRSWDYKIFDKRQKNPYAYMKKPPWSYKTIIELIELCLRILDVYDKLRDNVIINAVNESDDPCLNFRGASAVIKKLKAIITIHKNGWSIKEKKSVNITGVLVSNITAEQLKDMLKVYQDAQLNEDPDEDESELKEWIFICQEALIKAYKAGSLPYSEDDNAREITLKMKEFALKNQDKNIKQKPKNKDEKTKDVDKQKGEKRKRHKEDRRPVRTVNKINYREPEINEPIQQIQSENTVKDPLTEEFESAIECFITYSLLVLGSPDKTKQKQQVYVDLWLFCINIQAKYNLIYQEVLYEYLVRIVNKKNEKRLKHLWLEFEKPLEKQNKEERGNNMESLINKLFIKNRKQTTEDYQYFTLSLDPSLDYISVLNLIEALQTIKAMLPIPGIDEKQFEEVFNFLFKTFYLNDLIVSTVDPFSELSPPVVDMVRLCFSKLANGVAMKDATETVYYNLEQLFPQAIILELMKQFLTQNKLIRCVVNNKTVLCVSDEDLYDTLKRMSRQFPVSTLFALDFYNMFPFLKTKNTELEVIEISDDDEEIERFDDEVFIPLDDDNMHLEILNDSTFVQTDERGLFIENLTTVLTSDASIADIKLFCNNNDFSFCLTFPDALISSFAKMRL